MSASFRHMESWSSCSNSVLGAAPARCCELLQIVTSAPARRARSAGQRTQSLVAILPVLGWRRPGSARRGSDEFDHDVHVVAYGFEMRAHLFCSVHERLRHPGFEPW